MVIYQGYCRPLKQKVDFTVDTVECLKTKKGQKWVVKGVHEGHKITTFTNKATGESLMEQLGITREAEEVVVFDAEEAVIEAPNHEEETEELEVFDAEEVVLEAPKIEHEELTSKHYRKDGTLDMRYKICREIARGMKAESFEEVVEEDVEREMDAESLEDYTPEELATSNVNVGDITVDAGKGGYGAEGSELKKDSCCCGADKEKPCACMFTGADCSAKEPMCQCYKDLAEAKSAESFDADAIVIPDADSVPYHITNRLDREGIKWKVIEGDFDAETDTSFDAESYNRVYKAEPNAIIFEEHIPPEVWNNMGPDAQGHYLSTRDESVLIAPCCGVTKAELRMDENANAECDSCCYSGDDFHRRWWVNKPVPTVRAKLEAETVEQESLNPNTVVVPRFVYYKMMMHLPPNVSITQTDDGLSMIIGFHNQDAKMIEALVESYTPDMDGSDVEDTLRIDDDLSIVPSVYYPEESMGASDFNAEVFNVELQEWGEQEMKTHGKNISFKDWLDEESETHGDMPLVEWAKDEEESHDERYGAEGRPASYMVGSDVHELGNATDKLERLTDSEKEYPEWWKSRLSVATDEVDGLADYLDYAEESGAIDRLQAESNNPSAESYQIIVEDGDRVGYNIKKLLDKDMIYWEFVEGRLRIPNGEEVGYHIIDKLNREGIDYIFVQRAESFEAPESQSPKMNKTLVGLLGLGALGAFLAPEQIRALFKKLK